MVWILVLLGLAALLALAVVAMYNGLVRLREQVDASWSNIDVELKRRHDLIPNLVETVKGYAAHEKTTLERVIQARNAAIGATGPVEAAQAENVLTGALRQIFALAEAYPDLKANQNFLQLQGQLSQVENQIQRARTSYNAVVQEYNTKTRQIPTNIIATAFGFDPREFFEIEEEARAVPKVQF
jgi:LemA protein